MLFNLYGLFRRYCRKYKELKKKLPDHEVLRYFSFQEDKLILSDDLDIYIEFRERFGPQKSEMEKFKSYKEYKHALTSTIFQNYLNQLEQILQLINSSN